jgi:hypothetical protein
MDVYKFALNWNGVFKGFFTALSFVQNDKKTVYLMLISVYFFSKLF